MENFDDFENALVLRFFHEELSDFLVELLLVGKRIETIFIVTEEPESSLQMFKNQFDTIEAAGGLVRNNEGKYLIIERLGKWDLPKGKFEKGETTEQCALREVEEECGVNQLKIIDTLSDTYHMYQHKEKMVFKRTYWYLMETSFEGNLVPQVEEQITDAQWMRSEEVRSVAIKNTYASLMPVFQSTTS